MSKALLLGQRMHTIGPVCAQQSNESPRLQYPHLIAFDAKGFLLKLWVSGALDRPQGQPQAFHFLRQRGAHGSATALHICQLRELIQQPWRGKGLPLGAPHWELTRLLLGFLKTG